MINEAWKTRPQIINSNNPAFYPFSFKTSKCSGNCNNINDANAKICVPDIVKDLKVKVFNLMSRTNKIRHIKCHETCKCICGLDAIVCNNKQRWNNDKCWYKCKELIDKGVCDKGYAWQGYVGKYLDYENCKCRKSLIDKLVDECDENIAETSLVKTNSTKCKHNSSVLHIVLFSIFFTSNAVIAVYCVYYKHMNRNEESVSVYDYIYQIKNY